jgi:protein tyrosine phosphatase type 4A
LPNFFEIGNLYIFFLKSIVFFVSSKKIMTANSRHLNRPAATYLEYRNLRFLILDQPANTNIVGYIEECKKWNVTHLVCVCELNYETASFEDQGIKVLNWEFPDGSPPPEIILDQWLTLVRDSTRRSRVNKEKTTTEPVKQQSCIAIHCKAGLGRAPVLVAVAMIEAGLAYDEAVERIRRDRYGALNVKQIQFLKKYQPKKRLQQKHEKCTII